MYLTIIPQARVEYDIIISYQTSASGIIVLLKAIKKSLLDLPNFALQEQTEENLMIAIFSRMAHIPLGAKPIKSLELRYTMVQFLIVCIR